MIFNGNFGQQTKETEVVRNRIRLAAVIALILSLVLVWRLFILQVVDYDRYQTLSIENHIRLQALPPVRGLVLDRNGLVLAQNTAVYTLQVIPEKVKNIDIMLEDVNKLVNLTDREISRFKKQVNIRPSFEKQLLKNSLTDEEAAKFAVNEYKYPGVSLVAKLQRDYPAGELTAHVLGYVGRISQQDEKRLDMSFYKGTSYTGKIGIEREYEPELLGEIGYEQVEIDAHGRRLRTISRENAKAGNTLYLSLDLDLQRIAGEALVGLRGAVVALDPNSGEILTMISSPSFDPNMFIEGMNTQSYQSLRDDPNKPLLNRAIYGRYAPGSTIKPIIALAALDNNINPQSTVFCPGWYMLPDSKRKYRCWKKTGHGAVNMTQAIEQSCDAYFYKMGADLGISNMARFLSIFGLGDKTGVDLPGEPTGLVPDIEWKRVTRQESWYPGEDVITAIGQGYLIATPLQLARAAGMLANGGKSLIPKILLNQENKEKDEVISQQQQMNDQPPDSIFKKKDWNRVISAMEGVVHGQRGTARATSRGISYNIAGKTGTAQVVSIAQDKDYDENELPENLRDHALFIAFAPVDKPEIAIAVVVENGGSGAKVAAPIARKVMDHYFLKRVNQASIKKIRNVFG